MEKIALYTIIVVLGSFFNLWVRLIYSGRRIRESKEEIARMYILWTFGLLWGFSILILVILRRLKITGYQLRKFKSKKGLLIILNHPSLYETGIIPALLIILALFSFRYFPYSTPDKNNYYKKWWFLFLRLTCIPIDRGNRKEEIRTIYRINEDLNKGKVVILFPEGGRTFKGKEFVYAENREKIRKFSPALIRLFGKKGRPMTNFNILPVLTRGTDKILPNNPDFSKQSPIPKLWKQAFIFIGNPYCASIALKQQGNAISYMERSILDLADKYPRRGEKNEKKKSKSRKSCKN